MSKQVSEKGFWVEPYCHDCKVKISGYGELDEQVIPIIHTHKHIYLVI